MTHIGFVPLRFGFVLYLSVGAFVFARECRSYGALCALFLSTQGFISGFALISPWAMRECRPCRAFCRIGRLRYCVVVLCSLNVFGCVNGLLRSVVYLFDCIVCGIGRLWCCVVVLCSLNVFGCVNELLRSFVYLFDCDCIVCGIEGIDCCVRAISPNGAILLQSPGRKPWVNHWNTFIEPLQGRH